MRNATMKIDSSDIGALFFVAVIIIFVCAAIFAPYLAPFRPGDQDLTRRFTPPFTGPYLLGTDHLGRDILTRLILEKTAQASQMIRNQN